MKRVILYIGISLDGYIADREGGVGWMTGQDSRWEGDGGYTDFLSGVDTVVMGFHTYHQIITELSPDCWPYAGLNTYILTHREQEDREGVHFTCQPVKNLLHRLKEGTGGHIWICGGADVARQCMEHDLIDQYRLSLLPLILGGGIPLFGERNQPLPLRLTAASAENGIVECIYERR